MHDIFSHIFSTMLFNLKLNIDKLPHYNTKCKKINCCFHEFSQNCNLEISAARLGTPPRRGVEKPEGPSALQPTTEYIEISADSPF